MQAVGLLGRFSAIAAGLVPVSTLVGAGMNCAASCGLLPAAALFIFHKLDIKTQSVEAMREINNNDDQKGMDNYGKDKKFCKDE